MLVARDAFPKPQPLASAEFTTLQLHLPKIAERVTEAAIWVRIAVASACLDAELFRRVAHSLQLAKP